MKILDLPHKKCDYACMWNGLEDMYEWKTGKRAPDYLFFGLSGFCNFLYLKQKNADCKRMIYWSNGLTRKMYDFMEEIIGFNYKIVEGKIFENALSIAKKNINCGNPVILGALDIFHLPYYEKYYHKLHIPIHHFLMIGYDETKRKIFLHDCGKESVESLDYDNLKEAWDVNLPGFSKKNSIFVIQFNSIKNIEIIIKEGLLKKCEINLNPPVSIFGIPAMKKLGKELSNWKEELNEEDYLKVLYHLVEYTGFPPTLPVELINNTEIDKNELPNNHKGSRDKFSDLLEYISVNYNFTLLNDISALFKKSGFLIDKLTNEITKSILHNNHNNIDSKEMIFEIADIEEEAYTKINTLLK